MSTWHIHIKGQVQGVGFRPAVYRLACEYGLKGWVSNMPDGLHIEINGGRETAHDFLHQLLAHPPPLARITGYSYRKVDKRMFDRFEIAGSESTVEAELLLTPDATMCDNCRDELKNPADRRFAYPFITCTHCGPRYSIIRQLPYDREHTAMASFPLCTECEEEYHSPADRRYYSQTNSCGQCPITLSLIDREGQARHLSVDQTVEVVCEAWQKGDIVAIKGIGGYLLTCDAMHEEAIRKLRHRKHRPSKPLALMFPDLPMLAATTRLRLPEKEMLCSTIAPVLLLDVTDNSKIQHTLLAPNLDQVGAMLPYTPLYDILLSHFGRPIVATSGNISKSPILFQDPAAIFALSALADLILTNDRDIVLPQDDSVIRYTYFSAHPIILRRSRGMAPTFIHPDLQPGSQSVLALGAELKSTFTLLHQQNVYISQYLGDLSDYGTQKHYQDLIRHFLELFHTRPEVVLVDLHPDYAATRYGRQLAEDRGLPVFAYQHHIAHFAAVLGEHNLIDTSTEILGFIWDGTGLGTDGQIWGGESFTYADQGFGRIAHFEYFPFILGDKMPREPRISALCWCRMQEAAAGILQEKFSDIEWRTYQHLLGNGANMRTSSAGRLFDAVASLLGLCDRQTYEGEAAMQLENLALAYCKEYGMDTLEAYPISITQDGIIRTSEMAPLLLQDIAEERPVAYIAARFHYTMVFIVRMVAERYGIRSLAFSGGVFQNALLVDMLLHFLSSDYTLYFHHRLSPNDENISFGQMMCHHIHRRKAGDDSCVQTTTL